MTRPLVQGTVDPGRKHAFPPTSTFSETFPRAGVGSEDSLAPHLKMWLAMRSTLVSKATIDHSMRRAGEAFVLNFLSADLIRSDQIIAKGGSSQPKGRGMTTAPGINWAKFNGGVKCVSLLTMAFAKRPGLVPARAGV